MQCGRAAACVPMSTRAARLPLGAPRLVTRLAPALAAGPFPPVRRGPSARATPRRPGWMQRIGTARRANVQRVGDRRAPCAAVEGHRLKVRCGHVSATASGRIWQRPPGQLVTAWPAFGARRMQQAGIGADSCAALARPCRDHAPQESRRTRGHPSAWSAALPSWSLRLRFQGNWIRRGECAWSRPKDEAACGDWRHGGHRAASPVAQPAARPHGIRGGRRGEGSCRGAARRS